MYMNKFPFVITTSQAKHFCTAELIRNEKAATVSMTIKQVVQIYHRCGFKVQNLYGDGQFEHIKSISKTETST